MAFGPGGLQHTTHLDGGAHIVRPDHGCAPDHGRRRGAE